MNENILDSSIRGRLKAQDRKASGLCPAQKLRSGSAQLGRVVGRQRRLGRGLFCSHCRTKQGFKQNFVCLFTFSNTSTAFLTFRGPCIVTCDRASWCSLIIKPTRCTDFSNLFLEYNSTCFGQFLYPSSGVLALYTQ
jgi:hypothetical protein